MIMVQGGFGTRPYDVDYSVNVIGHDDILLPTFTSVYFYLFLNITLEITRFFPERSGGKKSGALTCYEF